jgi:hypothetical protein
VDQVDPRVVLPDECCDDLLVDRLLVLLDATWDAT